MKNYARLDVSLKEISICVVDEDGDVVARGTAPADPARVGVHPTMIHQWKRALLEGASGVFERGGKKVPEIDEEQVRDLHAKIGELAVANDFLARKLKPWTGK